MPKKCILIILDGLGDRSYHRLIHRTPLQAARTPIMEYLATKGINGLYHAARVGQALPSENAHFSMFGYDDADFPGRGALEALGAGIALEPEDVAILTHFSTVSEKDKKLVLENGKPVASEIEISQLVESVSEFEKDSIRIRYHQTKGLSGILTLHGDVSPFVTDSDPILAGRVLSDICPWMKYRSDRKAVKTAAVLKSYLSWVFDLLKEHPVTKARAAAGFPLINTLVTQRAGQLKERIPFRKRYGLRAASVASGLIYKGIFDYLGIDFHNVEDTDNLEDDMVRRLETARDLMTDYDLIHVHTKAPDEAAHTKDPIAKRNAIESLDKALGRVLASLKTDPEVMIILTSDHSTPSSGPLIHSGEPVPITMFGKGIRRDKVKKFDEISVTEGALGTIYDRELLYLILNHLDRSKLHGLMDTPCDQPFWPGNYDILSFEPDETKAEKYEKPEKFVESEKKYQYDMGVIHGRFQVLHNDHVKYLLAGKELCRHMVIGITNPDPFMTKEEHADPVRSDPMANPLSYFERYTLLTAAMDMAGIKPREYSIVPMPINMPDRYKYYVPEDAVFFLSIYDEWGRRKKEYFETEGLATHVLWEVPLEEKGISAVDIRESMIEGQQWEHLIPEGVTDLLKKWKIPDRLRQMQKISTNQSY